MTALGRQAPVGSRHRPSCLLAERHPGAGCST